MSILSRTYENNSLIFRCKIQENNRCRFQVYNKSIVKQKIQIDLNAIKAELFYKIIGRPRFVSMLSRPH